jgi:hypothetical protein
MHYFIISIIIAIIVVWQFASFLNNKGKIANFKNIFPDNSNKFQLEQENKVCEIRNQHKNVILDVIVSSLNNYLNNNNNAVSDFHLMKDIVDRNCDAREEEINAQIPVPLYLGLAGTMLGILIGVGFLVFAGGLEDLLNSGNGSGAEGIETLLGGVALAMISSILGIMLTTFGSHLAKNAKSIVEQNKNTFLSWIQAELLPNISSDTSSALIRMTRNLSSFNNTFAENTKELRATLSQVNDSYQKQAEMMRAINRLKIGEIASANIEVYDKLRNSTNEIGIFAQYLSNANEYLSNIQILNRKLDDYERRTQIIESAGKFFAKNEKWLAENFDIANLEVKSALERFNSTTENSLAKLQESLNGQILNFDSVMQQQNQRLQEALVVTTEIVTESFTKTYQNFEKAISDQQIALQRKLQETTRLVDELKNLTSIKEGIKDFKEDTNKQNIKIEELTKEIRVLAKTKMEGGPISQVISIPRWSKILVVSGGVLISLACLMFILPSLINWFKILINWIF